MKKEKPTGGMKEMTTEELIKFLVEAEFINYAEDYEIIDEIVKKLKSGKITEKWIEEKAFEVYDIVHSGSILKVKDFIRSLVEGIGQTE